jgi:ferredoxin--NADP+ reductase
VLRSVGYRGTPLAGLPFDEQRSVLPHVDGRVVDPVAGAPVRGVYTAGWIKRGPSGIIGSNKKCARETVASLLADYEAGVLPEPTANADGARGLLPDALDVRAWQALDAYERDLGGQDRPRRKLVDVDEMMKIARAGVVQP